MAAPDHDSIGQILTHLKINYKTYIGIYNIEPKNPSLDSLCSRCPHHRPHLLHLELAYILLRTNWDGTPKMCMVDFMCKLCRSLIHYEGRNDGSFCLNKKHVLTRELVDSWLLDICGTGGTFRDVFFSWESRISSKIAGSHTINAAPTINRKTANEALCKFLML